MNDIALEIIRLAPIVVIFTYLIASGKSFRVQRGKGWRFIIWGFGILLFATIIDITDNFESLNKYVIIGDTPTQAVLEKVIGYLGGFVLLAIGFAKWLPTINELNSTKQKLKELNERLEKHNFKLETNIQATIVELENSKKDLEMKNETLKRLNDKMTGRELKMIELKEKLKKYETGNPQT